MRQALKKTAFLALVAALSGPACTATGPSGPPRSLETSYPSPDYPAEAAPAPAPRTATPAQIPGLAERPLTAPVRAAAPAPAQVPTPVPASAPMAAAVPPAPSKPVAPTAPALDFQAIDADRNGRITLEEWRNFQEREFRRHDANNDGVLTQDELAAPSRKPTGPAARAMP